MPPQQAGEISMRMHSGEQKQPLPCQVPAISFGESSLGRSCPRLMGAHVDEFARRGALSWTSGGAITVAKFRDRNVDVATPERKLIGTDRVGEEGGGRQPARTSTSSTDAKELLRAAHAGTCTLSTGPGRGNRRGRALGPGAGGKHERE